MASSHIAMTPHLLLVRTASAHRSGISLSLGKSISCERSSASSNRLRASAARQLSTTSSLRTASNRDRDASRLPSRSATGIRKGEAAAENQAHSPNSFAYASSPSHAGGSSSGVHSQHTSDRPPAWSPPPDVTPASLVSHLDQYVVGQSRAKKSLAVGLFNHFIRLKSHRDRVAARAALAEREELKGLALHPPTGKSKGPRSSTSSARKVADLKGGVVPQAPNADPQQLAEAAAAAHSDVLSDFVGQTRGSRRGADGWPVPEASSGGPAASSEKEGRIDPLPYFSSHRPASAPTSPASTRNLSDRAARALESADRHLESRSGSTSSSPDADRLVAATEAPVLAKSNVLLLGPSGSGKTLLISSLARKLNLPFVTVDATPFTQAGYVGEDVETIVQRLLVASGWDAERASMGIVCIDEADKIARRPGDAAAKDVSGEGVQQALLRMLEGTQITVTDKSQQSQAPSAGPWWPPHQSPSGAQAPVKTSTGAPGGSNAPASGQGSTFVVDTTNVLFVLCGAFTGLPDVVRARLAGDASGPALGASRSSATGQTATTAVSSSQTQEASDLYELVEPEDLNAYGLIPEFLGRIPVLASLRALSEEELFRVLTEPRDSLTAQYEALFAAYGVELRFTTLALRSLAQQAHAKSTGARALRRLCETRLLEAMYAAPGGAKFALVDEAAARDPTGNPDGKLGEVHLYSRGGRLAFERAWRDEEEEAARRDAEAAKLEAERRKAELKAARAKGKATANVGGTKGTSPASISPPSPALASSMTAKPHGNAKQTPVSTLFGGAVTEAMLRRRARARLTRPSRVGNLRIVAE